MQLDFTINNTSDRIAFLNNNLPQNASEKALEMAANYILWSQEDATSFQIESSSPWSKGKGAISLEALIEQEGESGAPNELRLGSLEAPQKKAKLDRAEVAPRALKEGLLSEWKRLWHRIDCQEALVQSYERLNGLRKGDRPLREELVERLIPAELDSITDRARTLSHGDYVREKRLLVTLRKEQYELLDSMKGSSGRGSVAKPGMVMQEEGLSFRVLPFDRAGMRIGAIGIECFSDEFMRKCVQELIWHDEAFAAYAGKGGRSNGDLCLREMNGMQELLIDMRQGETVRKLILGYRELKEGAQESAALANIVEWLDWYADRAKMEPHLRDIYCAKANGMSNREIAQMLKAKYDRDYKDNYISTIFVKQVVGAIAEEAEKHYRLIEYITLGKSVFKTCSRCGKMLPRNSDYFNKKNSAVDGFLPYCKECK